MTSIIAIIAVIGAILIGIFLTLLFLTSGMRQFKENYARFARCFVDEFSQTWDFNAVSVNVSEVLRLMDTVSQGQAMLSNFRLLGRFVYQTSHVEIKDYKSGNHGKSGLFCFSARFEHAAALVQVGLLAQKDGGLAVDSVSIEPIPGTQTFRQSARQPARLVQNQTQLAGNVVEFRKKSPGPRKSIPG